MGNLDRSEHHCNPEWNFKRIDGQDESISSGFNYRTVTYDTTEGSRSLAKLYGIRFVFVTEGTAGRFSFAAATVTFGAGLAYLSVAAIIADLIMLKFLGQKSVEINEAKNEEIVDDDGMACFRRKVEKTLVGLSDHVSNARRSVTDGLSPTSNRNESDSRDSGNVSDGTADSVEL